MNYTEPNRQIQDADSSLSFRRVVDRLDGVGIKVTRTGGGFSATCPAHDDQQPSLSISVGNDGRVLLHCHAGCNCADICAALGLSEADLFEQPSVTASPNAGNTYRKTNGKPKTKYDYAGDATVAYERKFGEPSKTWTYHNDNGDPVGLILRWDRPGGKEIRPVSKQDGKWILGGMPAPRPLYCLSELVDAKRVYITEGEKAADAARSIGLVATTSAHGSKSPDKTDWSPLAGKECVILPDNDEAGRKYAEALRRILAGFRALNRDDGPAQVLRTKVVHLPGLPDKGDMADFVSARLDTEPEELRQEVENLADEAPEFKAEASEDEADGVLPFKPFPVDVFPQPIRKFIEEASKSIECDASYLALPMLSALGAAIGNSRWLKMNDYWKVPPNIWSVIIGQSGTRKSPAFRVVTQAMSDLQKDKKKEFDKQIEDYLIEFSKYEKDLAKWKSDKRDHNDPPIKPTMISADRYFVSDVTVEALAVKLKENPRGLGVVRDELSGWFGSFDRYAQGAGGADVAHWLSMFGGDPLTVDRKTGLVPSFTVDHASVSITGGIQPKVLQRVLRAGSKSNRGERTHVENGVLARFLLTHPPRKRRTFQSSTTSPKTQEDVREIFRWIYETLLVKEDNEPSFLELDDEARESWDAYQRRHEDESFVLDDDTDGDLLAAFSKLEEYPLRLALVFHYVKVAAGYQGGKKLVVDEFKIDKSSMEAGIVAADWCKYETTRVYATHSESDEERDQRRLIEFIQRKGGSVTVRDVQQGMYKINSAEHAREVLDRLVKAGAGSWEQTPTGRQGRPTRQFVLLPTSTQ